MLQATEFDQAPKTARSPIRASIWRPGERPRWLPLERILDEEEGVRCIEIDHHADPAEALAGLEPLCPGGLTLEMVEDLLDRDKMPEVGTFEDDRIRKVSAFGVRAHRDEGAKTGQLVFRLIEFLAGRDWLVVCCQPSLSYATARTSRDLAGEGCQTLLAKAESRWREGNHRSAGDLGVVLLNELICTFGPARREVYRWLDEWELDFYASNADAPDSRVDRETLIRLRGLISEFRVRLAALNVRQDDAGHAWFNGVTNDALARRADRDLDKSLDGLTQMAEMVRGAFDLVQAHDTAHQLRLAEAQRGETESWQRKVEFATVVFLVPTLVAAVWGENTWVPGQTRAWGFLLTIAFMVAGTAVALMLLRARSRRQAG